MNDIVSKARADSTGLSDLDEWEVVYVSQDGFRCLGVIIFELDDRLGALFEFA